MPRMSYERLFFLPLLLRLAELRWETLFRSADFAEVCGFFAD